MSYNLMAEGDFDLVELAHLAASYPVLEVFPIPADHDGRDAIGIAIPSSRADETSYYALCAFVTQLWNQRAAVFDLMSGQPVATPADLEQLRAHLGT